MGKGLWSGGRIIRGPKTVLKKVENVTIRVKDQSKLS